MKDPNQAYWRANIKLLAVLLAAWFIVSFGCGILFVDELDKIQVGGFKLGFWFAQQGSIYLFIVIILIYLVRMNKLDKTHDVEED